MRPKPFGLSVPLFLALFSDGQMMSSPSQPHLALPRKEGSDPPFRSQTPFCSSPPPPLMPGPDIRAIVPGCSNSH